MLYIGVDPSFTRTGLCLINTKTKKIVFYAITPSKMEDIYVNRVLKSVEIADSIQEKIKEFEIQRILIYEEPAITSIKASILGILSGVLGNTFLKEKDLEVYTLNPNTIYLMNRKIAKRSDKNHKNISREISLEIIKAFEQKGWEIKIDNEEKTYKSGKPKTRVLTTDESEAFLMVLHLMLKLDKIEESLREDIIKINRNLIGIYNLNKLEKGEKYE